MGYEFSHVGPDVALATTIVYLHTTVFIDIGLWEDEMLAVPVGIVIIM